MADVQASDFEPQPAKAGKYLFAELLAEGWTILEIREHLGLTETAAQNFIKQIRTDLGAPGRD